LQLEGLVDVLLRGGAVTDEELAEPERGGLAGDRCGFHGVVIGSERRKLHPAVVDRLQIAATIRP
jgi:hypothetical protein